MTKEPAEARILAYHDPAFGPFPTKQELEPLCHGADLTWLDSLSQIENEFSVQTIAIVTNSLSAETITDFHARCKSANPGCCMILVTEKPHSEYSRLLGGQEHEWIDHFIAARFEPSMKLQSIATTDLRSTLQKIIRKDYFGIEKYLRTGTKIDRYPITSSADREPLHQAVTNFVLGCGLSQTTATIARQIVQELLLNAIYDAPNAAGRNAGNEKSGRPIDLPPEDQGILSLGFDGSILAIGVRDPFGLFKRDKFFTYARKALYRANADAIIDTKVEGAGLGLMTIYLRSQGLICNVEPSVATEVIALIDSSSKTRDFEKSPRSLHYFDATGNRGSDANN